MKRTHLSIIKSLLDYTKVGRACQRSSSFNGVYLLYRAILSRICYGIGPRFFALFEFHHTPKDYWASYALDEELRPLLRDINPPNARRVVYDKELFFLHCQNHSLPTIPILARFVCGDRQTTLHSCNQTARLDLRQDLIETHKTLFFKTSCGTGGKGSFFAQKRGGEAWEFSGQTGAFDDLLLLCDKHSGTGALHWIVQPVIKAHREILTVTSVHGLSTVRAITVFSGGSLMIYLAMLRITVGHNASDNFSQGRSGNLVAPIDLESGRLGPSRGSADCSFPMVVKVERHPDTKIAIEGFQMPLWEETKSLILRAHSTLPQLRTLAWDVGITDSGPLIIEANATYDVSGMQVAHQRGVKIELLGLLAKQ